MTFVADVVVADCSGVTGMMYEVIVASRAEVVTIHAIAVGGNP